MITPASDCALLVSFGQSFSEEAHLQVRALVHALQSRRNFFLREIQPAYSSVLLTFDPLKTDSATLTAALRPILAGLEKIKGTSKSLKLRRVDIPVCYQDPVAFDLPGIAHETGLSVDDIIALHSSTDYTVCFFGFMPGFSYWSGLPVQLAVPRLPTPRLKVPAGSVGIGGSQTGIYPLETPGGWRIIGRTPLRLFDPAAKQLCLLQLGDCVRLKPISPREFKTLGGTWES